MKIIIYKKEDNGVAVMIPTEEYLKTHTIEECAQKDVPSGYKYQIIEDTEIPQDDIFRDAWEYQE
jgi:hypothetical protein